MSPTSRCGWTWRVGGTAPLLAMLALLAVSLVAAPVSASPRPGVSGGAPMEGPAPDPRSPARKAYDAWLAKQRARFETPQARASALAQAAKLPVWKANAHEITPKHAAPLRGAAAPNLAVPVTTDPNNWAELGPGAVSTNGEFFGGSVTAISASATNPSDIWVATSNGGVWNSTDQGANWTPKTDSLPTLGFGAVAVDPTNDRVIFAGSGDPDSANPYPAYPPYGMFKSIDNGATWIQVGQADFGDVNSFRIAIDPSNDQTILAAVGGGNVPRVEAGVWRSTDGGASWSQTLYDSGAAGLPAAAAQATDVVFDPANPAIVYAALGNVAGADATSPDGIYQSADHGATWTLLSGAPAGPDVGRISLAISHDGARLYAAIANGGYSNSSLSGALLNSSIYEYDTVAATWSSTSLTGSPLDTNGELLGGWNRNNVIAVAPADATDASVYLGHTGLYLSTDSGATWTEQGADGTRGRDQQSLYFPEVTSPDFFLAGLQGFWRYSSGTFNNSNATLDVTSLASGAYGDSGGGSPLYAWMDASPYYGNVEYPTSPARPVIWSGVASPSGQVAVDWSNNATVYGPSTICDTLTCTTTVEKSTDGGATFTATSLSTTDLTNDTLTISPSNPSRLYLGTTRLWASMDGGTTWNTISPQLDTKPTTSGTCAGPASAACPFITQIVIAPTTDNEILVSYSDATAYETTDGGATWVSVAPICPPGQAFCMNNGMRYAISPLSPYTIYASGNYSSQDADYAPGVFVSTNRGQSWSCAAGFASYTSLGVCSGTGYAIVGSIAVSPQNPHLLAVGGYSGAFVSWDDGVDWQRVGGLPNADVTSMFFSHDGSQLIVTTTGRGAWAIAMPHLALSQQDVLLTTPVGTSPANQTVTLSNSGQGTLTWSATAPLGWLTLAPSSGSIAPGATEQVTLSFNTSSLSPQTYATAVTFSSSADDPNLELPVTISSRLSKSWYFAEGYTGTGFTEYLTLANPNPVVANVSVQYLLQGQAAITKSYVVNPNARRTLNINTELGVGVGVSLVVTSDQPIIAERPMYFTFTGQGLHVPGGSDTLGATGLGQQFDFGYLDTTTNHATYLTVLNPNPSTMTVSVSYYPATGGTATVVTHSVAANARGTILVNSDVAPGTYSALVSLSANGLVERPMYLVDGATGYTGSADVIGVQQPTTTWNFAEGFTNANFSERYYLSNPSASATAHATVTFYRSDGTTATASVTLSPGQQQVVNANTVLGNGVNNSAIVSSDSPILAERFMSFTYHGPVGTSTPSSSIPGATDVLGATSVGQVYDFAEGYTGGAFGEYLTLENPEGTTTQVTVIYLPQNGSAPTVQQYFVGAYSRYTVLTNHVMVGQSFSMVVIADQPIVAERPMYFNYNGDTGGSDVVGYQP